MTSVIKLSEVVDVVIGVDTHVHTHAAAVVDARTGRSPGADQRRGHRRGLRRAGGVRRGGQRHPRRVAGLGGRGHR